MKFSRGFTTVIVSLFILLLTSCYPWRSSSLSRVNDAENDLQKAKQTGKLDSKVINGAIKQYHFFVMYFPYDSLTPSFVLREGELYQMDGDYNKAISTLTGIKSQYPKSKIVPDAIFLMATINEQNIKNQDTADFLYAELLFDYPDSKAAQKTRNFLESKSISSEDFYKKYAATFSRLEHSNVDSANLSVRYHAYWKQH